MRVSSKMLLRTVGEFSWESIHHQGITCEQSGRVREYMDGAWIANSVLRISTRVGEAFADLKSAKPFFRFTCVVLMLSNCISTKVARPTLRESLLSDMLHIQRLRIVVVLCPHPLLSLYLKWSYPCCKVWQTAFPMHATTIFTVSFGTS